MNQYSKPASSIDKVISRNTRRDYPPKPQIKIPYKPKPRPPYLTPKIPTPKIPYKRR